MIIHSSEQARKEFNERMDRELEAFIKKCDQNPVDPREQHLAMTVKECMVGYYIKHANNIDKRIAKNPEQQNYLCLFYDWVRTPGRIFKHYGFKSKLDNWLILRKATEEEEQMLKHYTRMVRKHVFNWNDIVEYHIRHGLDYDCIIALADRFTLDGYSIDRKYLLEKP
jgi:hypothetical protein